MPSPGSRFGFWSRVPVPTSLEIGCSSFPIFTPSLANGYNPFSAYGGYINKTSSGALIETRFLKVLVGGSNLSRANSVGCFGYGKSGSGIFYDVDGSSNYGRADFVTPGTPWEGYCVLVQDVESGSQKTIAASTAGSETYAQTVPTLITADKKELWQLGTNHYASLLGKIDTGYIINQVLVYNDEPVIRMNVSYTNTTDKPQLVWSMRGLDPDQDVYPGGTYNTYNKRGYKEISQSKIVYAQGTEEGNKTIAILHSETSYTTNAVIVSGWPTECYYPNKWVESSNAEGLRDWGICGIVYYGRVEPNQTVNNCLYYVFGPSIEDIYKTASSLGS